MRWPRGLEGRLCYGGDYNPEQWDRSVWAEDVALMRRAQVNLVTVGVFSWSTMEPQEGRYEFGWLDEVLDLLHRHDIRVALATPTASPPPWFSFAYPEALPVTRDGVRLCHGSRDTYCPSAPAYRAAAVRIATELGRRYGDHPALALWHVHNEYGTSCHCDLVAAAFQGWLRHRYATLERLNQAWTGAFWSQGYADWAHVQPPRATQYLPNPTQALDFRRFLSDELLGCFTDQRDALRPLSPGVPITTNFVLGEWVPVDHRRWAREVDLVAIDHYPDAADGLAAEEQTALAADRARGWAGGQPWLLMEQAPDLIFAGGRMWPKAPGRHARLTLSHVARGSIGALAFQWRASRGGAEQFGSAMLPHAGPASRVFAETVELGHLLAAPGLASTAPVDATVAIYENTDSGWALPGPGRPAPDLDRERIVRSVHSALWRAGRTVDFVAAGDDLTPYRLIFVPALFLTTAADVASLESYVEGGGTAVITFLSGIVDADNQIGPGAFRDLVGLTVEEFHPGDRWSERIRCHGAEPIPTHPSVTRHPYGQGTAYYIAEDQPLDDLLPVLGISPPAEPFVERVRRRDGLVFEIDHRAGSVAVRKEGAPLNVFCMERAPS